MRKYKKIIFLIVGLAMLVTLYFKAFADARLDQANAEVFNKLQAVPSKLEKLETLKWDEFSKQFDALKKTLFLDLEQLYRDYPNQYKGPRVYNITAYLYPELFSKEDKKGLTKLYKDWFIRHQTNLLKAKTKKDALFAFEGLKAAISSHELGARGEGDLSETGKLVIQIYQKVLKAKVKALTQDAGVSL